MNALISLAVAVLMTVLVYFGLGEFAPNIYVEKALNILVAAFMGSAGLTWLLLRLRRNRR